MTDRYPVLFGEVLFDCFEEDGSHLLGGAPFNVAWHLQGFGLEPRLISRVGDDPQGRSIRSVMSQWQMNDSCLQLDATHPTGEVRITLNAGQPTFDILENRAYDHIDFATIPEINPSLIYHGSLALRHAKSGNTLHQLLQRYQPDVFLDVNLRSPWWDKARILELLDHTRWLKINDDELHALVEGPQNTEDKAAILQRQHDLALVIVTEGEAGAICLNHKGLAQRVTPKNTVRVVDTVGAGDAFSAVCILGLASNWPLAQILHRAQAFASLIVAQRGAIIDAPNVYQRLLAEWQTHV